MDSFLQKHGVYQLCSKRVYFSCVTLVFYLVFFVDRPHHQTQILLTIIFNTLFKEESATVEVSAEFLKDSIRYTYLPTYIHAVS